MIPKNDYITWVSTLESFLNECGIESSEIDEFHINEAIATTERIIKDHNVSELSHITESMIDDYTRSAIKSNPTRKDYYETISFYVKKRLLQK